MTVDGRRQYLKKAFLPDKNALNVFLPDTHRPGQPFRQSVPPFESPFSALLSIPEYNVGTVSLHP